MLLHSLRSSQYGPAVPVPIAFEALGLSVETRTLISGDRVPLGQAVTIQVDPLGDGRVERGSLHFRAAGEPNFDQVELVSIGSTFFGIVPGPAVREGGVEYYVRLENSGVFVTDPPGAPGDSLYRFAVAAPTSITAFPRPTSRADFLPDSAISVEVTLPERAIFRSGALHYRRGGERSYTSDALAPPARPGIVIGTIPGPAVGPRGIEYWVEVNTLTSERPLTFPAVHPDSTPDIIRVTVRNLSEPETHPGRRYRLLSVPLDLGLTPPGLDELLTGQLGLYDPMRWRAFRYLPAARDNVELAIGDAAGRFDAVPGRAFWLITRDAHQINSGLAVGLSTASGSDYPVVLEQGWNMIANPFDFPVEWASVRAPAGVGVPVAFDPSLGTRGDYATTPPERLEPFEGYFIKSPADAETLWVLPIEAPTPSAMDGAGPAPPVAGDPIGAVAPTHAAREAAATESRWHLRLRAQTERALDGSNVIGEAAAAAEGLDPLDQPKPPLPPGEWVQLALRPPGGKADSDLFRVDLRAPGAAGHAWEIELRSSSSGEGVTLEAIPESALPDGLRLRLIDRGLGNAVDLRRADGSLASYRLLSPGPGRAYRLTLLAGSEAYVSQAPAAELSIPSRLVLDPAVPNPSSDAMRIRFGLPAAQPVTLEVIDVLGRRVAILLDRARQGAGYHALLWDGFSRGGVRVAGGVYFLRLSSGTGVHTRRIVRLE